ncbi:mandelate racemase/muconate lactonizing enzyme family protein [Litoreibacter roseus]|uniref:Enolase n=1 Tax=Litoreibacter roseus TaxID=2601869 RepID=A0A6N6JL59_9RHOB|nr:mandelate racemase/muconate lactonizing enzyme family protein [Litoreibacter roseus]GFE67056.1 enolase [Litoreibacter roseus]
MNPRDISSPDRLLKIRSVEAFPISSPVKNGPILGIGQLTKRESVVVRIETEDGIVGYGEAHHGRAAASVAHLINHTLQHFAVGKSAADVVGIWDAIYTMQLKSHGMGAASSIGMSGIDLALWDIRGKAVGWPLYRLLGGMSQDIPAYAGGVSLGWQPAAQLVDEVQAALDEGYKAVKLRVGDNHVRDVERVAAVRAAIGDDVSIMVDANTNYDAATFRRALPGFVAHDVFWIEEPFAPHDIDNYRLAAHLSSIPLAAGENHYTRFEFNRVIEDGKITILQPDVSKTGGITESMRIAAAASAWKRMICPHTSTTGLNMAASVHLLCAIDNAGYFEGDVSVSNPFRDELTSTPYMVGANGCVRPLEQPGIGVEVDEDYLRGNPTTEGLSYAAH